MYAIDHLFDLKFAGQSYMLRLRMQSILLNADEVIGLRVDSIFFSDIKNNQDDVLLRTRKVNILAS